MSHRRVMEEDDMVKSMAIASYRERGERENEPMIYARLACSYRTPGQYAYIRTR